MKLEILVVGDLQVNCYLYWDEATGDGVIIDPGADEQLIFEGVTRCGFTPKALLLTHGHIDHIAAAAAVKEKYAIPLYIGAGEEGLLADSAANGAVMLAGPFDPPEADVLVHDEQALNLGSVFLKVLATPGHTPAGVCYLDERAGNLFCGDTLFWGSVGRVDLPGGSGAMLMKSIKTKVLTLPDGVTCYPGHGPKTTVGAERVNNPFLNGEIFV